MNMPEAEVVVSFFMLKDHFIKMGFDVSEVSLETWTGVQYLDTVIFSPTHEGRNTRLYMVKNSQVYDFNPLQVSLSDAYEKLYLNDMR